MQPNGWSLAVAMSLIVALSVKGAITKGVMSVTGAEMH